MEFNFNIINGQHVTASESMTVINPATEAVIGQVPKVTPHQVDEAIHAAQQGFEIWSTYTAEERETYLLSWADKILENQDMLAELLSQEQGKPLNEALGEVQVCAKFIRWSAEEAKRMNGDILVPSKSHQRLSVIRQPVGVCALITPWNFPAAMVARKVAPAIATGCAFVLKPSSETPQIAIAFIDLLNQTGIPNGLANIVTGASSMISDAFLSHKVIKKISFTGSTEVGKLLVEKSAQNLNRLSLELGGNAPAIVFEDADLEQAVSDIVENKFENNGQMCNGINYILVHEALKARFLTRLIDKVKALKVGQWNDKNVNVGPLINTKAQENVAHIVSEATTQGASLVLGGHKMDRKGSFFEPTILDGVEKEMAILEQEIFGPVAPIVTFKSDEEAIEIANRTHQGLAAYFFTSDVNKVHQVAEQLAFGMVGVNGTQLSLPQAPFGGIDESGFGREGGHYGLDEYLELKFISLTLNK
ncbi:NAD-dependent succinate-semialdehyde dehydrogenase [Staphylococcus agnetis]|uniref:NAD-dependent succinate-semialdehyde dehydrogenase n=3 Tax=Staphylococcus agnetis TaxID=985762 RepID=UPI0004E2C701|nr:NAD-dependent succinate-semialdehyde dehydrogenase [Staphylococcus agnetis]KFE42072.1 succinate-semialdehyde dehydrogenase (NADP+) [Staphylococcus agnetis]NJH65687.1 aldehyde dehydrogenase family protein [Staphylococcus agnetis]PTH47757.1 NAD-dependent succinate-semialdehyde dehydrogenase [Staphylococcus agnetis]PTH74544.1 NAD-dependent succinate-semialdehyde dehydrogenase [Staphylococcus agnetis]PTH74988.1 NAD-dependent succinate-semialdehyde dehydrogenase [Staphylococcus agnetis]